jgi:hypothetical protein
VIVNRGRELTRHDALLVMRDREVSFAVRPARTCPRALRAGAAEGSLRVGPTAPWGDYLLLVW